MGPLWRVKEEEGRRGGDPASHSLDLCLDPEQNGPAQLAWPWRGPQAALRSGMATIFCAVGALCPPFHFLSPSLQASPPPPTTPFSPPLPCSPSPLSPFSSLPPCTPSLLPPPYDPLPLCPPPSPLHHHVLHSPCTPLLAPHDAKASACGSYVCQC